MAFFILINLRSVFLAIEVGRGLGLENLPSDRLMGRGGSRSIQLVEATRAFRFTFRTPFVRRGAILKWFVFFHIGLDKLLLL